MSAPINPLTLKPWTVTTLLTALRTANDIANDAADQHELCEVWEDIMSRIVTRTGLPFEGRPRTHHASVRLELWWKAKEPSEDELRRLLADILYGSDRIESLTLIEVQTGG